jgi:hypothetical protein
MNSSHDDAAAKSNGGRTTAVARFIFTCRPAQTTSVSRKM